MLPEELARPKELPWPMESPEVPCEELKVKLEQKGRNMKNEENRCLPGEGRSGPPGLRHLLLLSRRIAYLAFDHAPLASASSSGGCLRATSCLRFGPRCGSGRS